MRTRFSLLVGGFLAGILAGMPGQAQVSQETGAYAIVGVKVEIGDGRTLDKGTILLRNGLIEAVGNSLPIPPDAEVIKGDGLVAYPGFIDAYSTTGLKPPDAQPTQDRLPDTNALAPAWMRTANRKGVRPELRAAETLALTDMQLAPWRQQGFTTAWIAPTGGMINGFGTLVNLSGMPKRESIVTPNFGMSFAFSSGGGGFGRGAAAADNEGTGYPGSLLGIIAHTRQTLLDARWFETAQTAFAKGGGARPPADDALTALQPVLSGTVPVVYSASTENEIVRADRLADEFHLHLIVSGGVEAWKQSDLLVKKHIPVLLSLNFGEEPNAPKTPRPAGRGRPGDTPTPPDGMTKPDAAKPPAEPPKPNQGDIPEKPSADPKKPGVGDVTIKEPAEEEEDDTPTAAKNEIQRKWEEKTANAAQLQKAGVLFAFSTQGLRPQSDFWKNLRRAMQSGLPRQAALAGLSLNAAKIFGLERQLGTIETGKIANITLMTGDFADAKSKVKYLFIDRSKFEPEKETPARPTPPPAPPAEMDDEKE